MKHYVSERPDKLNVKTHKRLLSKKKKKFIKKDDTSLGSDVTKRDLGLTENARIIME